MTRTNHRTVKSPHAKRRAQHAHAQVNANNKRVQFDPTIYYSTSMATEDLRRFKSPMRKILRGFTRRIKLCLLVFMFFLLIQSLEGRPSMETKMLAGQFSGDSNGGGSSAETEAVLSHISKIPPRTLVEAPHAATTKPPKHHLTLAVHDEEIHHMERYPVSQFDFGHVSTPFIIGIWILWAGIAKIAFHMTPKLHNMVPESCLLIVVGVIIGIVLFFGTNVFISPLTPTTFFLYMLPPIILDAGYFMPNRKFFDNLGTILLMAVVGTIFNIVTIGGALYACGLTGIFGGVEQTPGFLDIFLFASLISAVDPVAVLAVFEELKVNEILYIVVFGESLLNDAVTVVMYHMMEAYDEIGMSNIIIQDIASGVASFFVVALGGTIIGIIWGFLLGFITRFTHHVLIIEPIFVFVMAYLSYLNAEMFHMSGILAITFCGMTAKNYVEVNTSEKSRTTIKCTLKMLSSSAETIIFMFLGVATVHNNHVWNTWFVILTIVFCSVFRAVGVIIFSALANRFRLHKLSTVDQFVMSYGGLRGAVAFALVLLIDERVVKQKDMFVTTTIAVIYFTVFIQGITIKPLVELLGVNRANDKELTMNERINERFIDHMMAGIEDIIGHNGNYNLRDKFRRFNDRFIRPCLIRDLEHAEHKFIRTYSKLTMRDAMTVMRRNPSTLGQIAGNESISAIFRNYATNSSVDTAYFRANLDAPGYRNLDIHELDYYPSKRDIFDAEIHHLRIEQYRPYKGKRGSIAKNFKNGTISGSPTATNRTAKIRFPRYIKDRKKIKLLQQSSVISNQAEKAAPNPVTFSDAAVTIEPTPTPTPPNNVQTIANKQQEDEEEEEGLTFKSILKEPPVPSTPSIDDDIGGELNERNLFEKPWQKSCDENFNAVQQLEFPHWAKNKEYLPCHSPKDHFIEDLQHTMQHLNDSNNAHNGKPMTPTTSNGHSKENGLHSILEIDDNQPLLTTTPQAANTANICLDCIESMQSSQADASGSTTPPQLAPYFNKVKNRALKDKNDKIEVTMTLLPRGYTSSENDDDDEDFDKYCDISRYD